MTKTENKALMVYPDSSVIDMPNDEERFTHNFIMKEKRDAFTVGYEQAEKETIERIHKFLLKQAMIGCHPYSEMEFANYFRKEMEED